MARHTINNEESKLIKKILKKSGEIIVSNTKLDGVIKIKGYRKYQFRDEVDIIFIGKVFVTIRSNAKGWYDSSILKDKGFSISIFRLNRFLRGAMIKDIQFRMNYFGVNMGDYSSIKTISWE
jgi:hypothetical protein